MLRLPPAIALAAALAGAQDVPQAFIGARVIPIAGPEIENGTVVIHDGKIVAVGESSETATPDSAERHDVAGKVIMPGFVDTHSHAGNVEGGDGSGPMHPDARALDSINVRDARLQKAQAGGITTSNIMPGSGHLLSGQTLYVKHRDGKTIDDLLIRRADGSLAYGVKMANGTNSRRDPPFPGTRAKSAALVRERFVRAAEYRDRVARAEGDLEKLPPRDLGLETLVDILEGKRVVHFHTHRHDDISTVLRLAEEFGFRVVLQHVSDGWLVADQIAASPHVLGASLILIDSPGGKIEAKDNRLETARILDAAGVLTGFHSDDSITDSRLFNRMAALGVRAGMPRERALYGLTMAGAQMLEMEDRIGSLEPGKDADLIVLSGDPLSVYTQVLQTWVDGSKVFDRSNPKDRLYAEGGFGASHDQGAILHGIAKGEHE
ncbi:MAG: amidohydrolase family protein [Bryobacterales bacterium]|nr:amidohydrolase family protein [Bryobacterales bacterium]